MNELPLFQQYTVIEAGSAENIHKPEVLPKMETDWIWILIGIAFYIHGHFIVKLRKRVEKLEKK